MRTRPLLLTFLTLAILSGVGNGEPLRLHPQNPHYFEFRGRPKILITSGEHYGAVLNRQFDYVRYLDTLEQDGLNLTRTFSGAYVEHPTAFNITRNTLAPQAGEFVCPWPRSSEPGYANGGNKFDLSRWESTYFARLKDFIQQASDRGIVVEVNLFCPFYSDEQWRLSPMNPTNNINGIGTGDREQVYTLDGHGGLLSIQEALVRKIVSELNLFDNIYFEVCNEPYFGAVTVEWHRHMAALIASVEDSLPNRHLISWNFSNAWADDLEKGHGLIKDPDPNISIYNFHYANPPKVIGMNYHLDRVIGDNETGFRGTGDDTYRREAWEFILAGGGLFNHLDYSFAVGFENGTFEYPETQPGGGSPELRRQFQVLAKFIHSFDFTRMSPEPDLISGGIPDGGRVQLLAETGRQYAAYLWGGSQTVLELSLPPGPYRIEWLNPLDGSTLADEKVTAANGLQKLTSPQYPGEVALKIVRD